MNRLTIAGLLFCFSCVSDKPDVKPEEPVSATSASGVFVINEGNFQWGNSSVSYYRFSDGVVTEDAFQLANQRPLGDVCQSMEVFNEKAYLVINKSGRVEIVDPKTFSSIGMIPGLGSPRYFLGISASKAYVSDLYSNAISVVDLISNKKIKDIPCHGWTEELIKAAGRVFVTNVEKEYVYVIDPVADVLEDSIKVGYSSNSIREDKHGKLWVLCTGRSEESGGSLHRIDPVLKKVELSVPLKNGNALASHLEINKGRDTLYFISQGVYQFPITRTDVPSSPLINGDGFLMYGLGIDPNTGDVYFSDAIDYVQRGMVYRYSNQGVFLNAFKAGIIPRDFNFY